MAGISFLDSSTTTIRRYDVSRHDRKEIMLLIDPSVSPVDAVDDDDDADDQWNLRKRKQQQVSFSLTLCYKLVKPQRAKVQS